MYEGYASESRNPYSRVSQEIAHEQRLQREARENLLGTLYHNCTRETATDVARVEVTYGYDVHDYDGPIGVSTLDERAGYYIVHVKVDGSGTEDDPLDGHPANLASDAVYEHVDPSEYAYFSVDDVSAA